MLSENQEGRIVRFKLTSHICDTPKLRMTVEQIFSPQKLVPYGMSPSAILVIKKINGTFNGEVEWEASDDNGLRIIKKTEWESSLQTRLRVLYRNAQRPSGGRISGADKAVLFNDRSELIAALCHDIASGFTTNRWWWIACFGEKFLSRTPRQVLFSVFLDSPSDVPAVATYLSKWHCAIKVMTMIDPCDAHEILHAVLRAYGLEELGRQMSRLSPSSRHGYTNRDAGSVVNSEADPSMVVEAAPSSNSDEAGGMSAGMRHYRFNHSSALPWLNIFQDEVWAPGLAKPQLALLGVARMLQTAPMTMRNEQFQKQVVNWWSLANEKDLPLSYSDAESSLINRSVIERQSELRSGRNRSKLSSDYTDMHGIRFEQPDIEPRSFGDETAYPGEIEHDADVLHVERRYKNASTAGGDQRQADIPAVEREHRETTPAQQVPFEDATTSTVHIDTQNGPAHHTGGAGATSEAKDIPAFDPVMADKDAPFAGTCYTTELGGVLYLINLLGQLDLPACLSEQWKLDQQIGRWALLDALARALLGKLYFRHREDPVWKVMAGLDHRHRNTLIGVGCKGHDDYAMPKAWFRHLIDSANDAFYWASCRGRLRVWSAAGVLLERSLGDHNAVDNQVYKDLKNYSIDISPAQIHAGRYGQAPLANVRRLQAAGIDTAFAHLLSRLLPPIQRYLQDILSLPAVTSHALLTKLFRCDGRIFVSSSHIDLVADINSTSLSIRRSGLDQDPGWLPEYGRVVLFHYE